MNEEKKYSLLTNLDIEEGLKNETFQKENISLIRDKEGKIVKHLPITDHEKYIFPPSLIQVNSTYIYQADITLIIEKIIETKNIELFEDLAERYQVVIDSLTYYKDHDSRLDELNSNSLKASSIFEKRVSNYLNNIEIDRISKIDIESSLKMLDTYLNVIFIYLISTYWLHKDKASVDTIASRKIEDLENRVRDMYEQLLAKSSLDDEGINRFPMHNSLYAHYFLKEENGVKNIETFIKHDSRFSSLESFFSFIQRCFLKNIKPHYNYGTDCQEPARFEIGIEVDDKDNNMDIKIQFTQGLFDILEKLDILKNIHNELASMGDINTETIKIYEASKVHHLTAIPLSLHSSK